MWGDSVLGLYPPSVLDFIYVGVYIAVAFSQACKADKKPSICPLLEMGTHLATMTEDN